MRCLVQIHVHKVPQPRSPPKAASKSGKGPKCTPPRGRKNARFRVLCSLKTSVLPTQTSRGHLAAEGLFSVWPGVFWDLARGQNDAVTPAISSPGDALPLELPSRRTSRGVSLLLFCPHQLLCLSFATCTRVSVYRRRCDWCQRLQVCNAGGSRRRWRRWCGRCAARAWWAASA